MTAERVGGTGCVDIHSSSEASRSGGMVVFTGLFVRAISMQ